MRTSHLQYKLMVNFMEENGDLSKQSGGLRGRQYIQIKWKELTNKLNSDGTGEPRSEEKWRKVRTRVTLFLTDFKKGGGSQFVWSDYKNNSKRKFAKINRASSGTEGGPAPQIAMTDLENRVLRIIAMQTATNKVLEEAGFNQDELSKSSETQHEETASSEDQLETQDTDWNTPGTSSHPTVAAPGLPMGDHSPSLPVFIVEEELRPPPQKKFKKSYLAKMFIEADRKAREYTRERDRAYDELEKERLRLKHEELRIRELEVQERVRQRDVELRLQGQWLEFMKVAMDAVVKYVDKKS